MSHFHDVWIDGVDRRMEFDDTCPACEAAQRELAAINRALDDPRVDNVMSASEAVAEMRAELADLRARLVATENVAFALGAMNCPPCFICGYNGPNYYQPEVHSCAERHHKYYRWRQR